MLQSSICRSMQTGMSVAGTRYVAFHSIASMQPANRLGNYRRLPRHVASQASRRLLSTSNIPVRLSILLNVFCAYCYMSQLIRPHALRKDVRALPGSVRNFSLWPSKPVATPESPIPSEQTPELPVEEQAASVITEVPEVPAVDVVSAPETTSALSDALASIPADTIASIPPMHYGDLAALGLCSWWPSGFFQWGMEAVHVSIGLPWFWTIIGATVFSRVVLAPFAIQGMRNAARLAPHQEEIQKMSAQMREAFAKKDQFEQQRLQLKQMALYKKIGVNPATSLISPLVQIPVSLGMFFAVKKMCELPVEQLKWSGVSFLPDLTATDPTWILPILTVAAINMQLTVRELRQ